MEKKPFGQGFQDAVYGGLQSIVQNPTVRKTASNIKEGFFNLYDPVAAKTTEIGLPLLQTLTPEVYYDKATREKMVEGIEPYKPSPEGMSNMDRLRAQYDRMIADFGAAGQAMFGQARSAAEKLNKGIAFEDLTPEEKSGARMFGFDVATAMIPGGIFTKPAVTGATTTAKTLGKTLIDKDSGLRLSAGPQNAAERISSLQSVAKVKPLTAEQKVELADLFPGMTPKLRADFAKLVPTEDLDEVLNLVKINFKPKPKGAYGGYGVIEKDGVVGVQYKKGQRVDKFVPLTDLQLTMRGPNSKRPGEFEFNILEDKRVPRNAETMKNSLEAANIANKEAQLAARAEEAKTIMKVFLDNKDLPMRSKVGDSLFTKVNEAIDPSTRIYRPDKKVSIKYITEILDEYGVRPIQKKAPDAETKRDLITGVTKLTGADPIVDPLVRSFNPKEFPSLARVEEFFKSQNINMKNIKRPLDEPRLFNAIESNRVALQDSLKANKFIQQALKERGETRPLTFNKSHLDRSIKPVTDADQFRGLDPTDVKILGETVNNFLQNDLEIVLLQKIQSKDVAGTKRIIKDMKNFGIGTRLNDPKRPGLTKEDYQWIDKNINTVKIPTISVGVGRPFKNYDAVLFGTADQPNVKQLVENELAARDYYKNKVNFEADFPGESYLQFFAGGGYVGNMEPVNLNVGGFLKGLFGKTPAYRQEGLGVSDLFGPTRKQKEILEQLYPGTSFPKTYPGEVFYSNLDLALSKRGAPESFTNETQFRDYMNQSGVGTDELDDAKIIPYIRSKSETGEPIFSQDLRRIADQSPIRGVFMDAYGFRSDKVNVANKTILDPDTRVRTEVEGEPVFKQVAYPNTGLTGGYLPNSYRERVFRIKKSSLRGDPGNVPGGRENHTFGGNSDTQDNYTLFWTRQTDRPAFIIPGEAVNKKSGQIETPKAIADQTKLNEIETKIQRLFADPIANLQPDDMEGVTAAVSRLVDSSAGRLTSGKAFNVVMGQIDAKQKQIKRLQNEYNAEKSRIDSFTAPSRKEIITTTIDELQSDILQNLRTKSRNIAGKLKIMADRGMSLDSMNDKELLQYFQKTGGVVRPLGKTKEELMDQYNALMDINRQLESSSKKFAFGINESDLNYYNSVKDEQRKIMDAMVNNISKDLMRDLYPDVPFKDRVQFADAATKQAIAEAAHRLFVEKDPSAPTHFSYMSGSQIKGNYSQEGGAATSAKLRSEELAARQKRFEDAVAGGDQRASLPESQYRGIGTEEFYGGPDVVNEQGGHFTGVMENIFKKIANEYGSKIEIANVATREPRTRDVFNIIDQDTGVVMGSGDTYRQAENIANDLVDSDGGRYRIATETEKVYDSRPVFTMEITPQMLQLFKAYK